MGGGVVLGEAGADLSDVGFFGGDGEADVAGVAEEGSLLVAVGIEVAEAVVAGEAGLGRYEGG
jgi:hypothetical protein